VGARAQTIDAGVDRDLWVGRGNLYYSSAIVGIDFYGKPGDCSGIPLQCRIPDNLGDGWMTKMQVKVKNRSPMTAIATSPNQFVVLHRSVLSNDVELGQQVQLEMKEDRAVVKNLERSRGR
jgi:hypothetical protein